MPLYEFRCPNGHDFEKFYRSIGTSSSQVECPVCGALAERRISKAGLVFKGSGFYITDYGKDGKKAEREAATAEKKKDDATAAAASAKSGGSTSESSSSAPVEKPKAADSAPATPSPSPATPPAKPAANSKSSE